LKELRNFRGSGSSVNDTSADDELVAAQTTVFGACGTEWRGTVL